MHMTKTTTTRRWRWRRRLAFWVLWLLCEVNGWERESVRYVVMAVGDFWFREEKKSVWKGWIYEEMKRVLHTAKILLVLLLFHYLKVLHLHMQLLQSVVGLPLQHNPIIVSPFSLSFFFSIFFFHFHLLTFLVNWYMGTEWQATLMKIFAGIFGMQHLKLSPQSTQYLLLSIWRQPKAVF